MCVHMCHTMLIYFFQEALLTIMMELRTCRWKWHATSRARSTFKFSLWRNAVYCCRHSCAGRLTPTVTHCHSRISRMIHQLQITVAQGAWLLKSCR